MSRQVRRGHQAEKEGLGIKKWEHQARWGAVLQASGPQWVRPRSCCCMGVEKNRKVPEPF